MAKSFSEFLREQEEKTRHKTAANEAIISEWQSAVEKLFQTLRQWLQSSDPAGILKVQQKEHDVTEPGLGRYVVSRLDIRGLGKWIGIIPKARNTIGSARPTQKSAPEKATGRVDITDELRRYVLYRLPGDDEDIWVIDDLHSESRPLTQEAFEQALMSYLQ